MVACTCCGVRGRGRGSSGLLIISPTEPLALRVLGITDLLPEEYGADYLFSARSGLVVVQRKSFTDLIASLRDGRLARELPAMRQADHPILLVEGRPLWTDQGMLISVDRPYHRTEWYGFCLSVQHEYNISMVLTDDINDTAAWMRHAPTWFDKPEHLSLLARPKPVDNLGNMAARDFGINLLQSFPGFGPKVASNVYDHFGRVPIRSDTTAKELQQISGVGKVRAQSFISLLGGDLGGKRSDNRQS